MSQVVIALSREDVEGQELAPVRVRSTERVILVGVDLPEGGRFRWAKSKTLEADEH